MSAGWGQRWRLGWLLGPVALLLLALSGCNSAETYVPNAAVILNPTPGQPSVFNALIVTPYPIVATPGPVYPTPWPPGPCPGCACVAYYTVCAGDTVSGIAHRYRTTIGAISQVNGLWNPNYIKIGQVLCIPPAPPPPPPCHACPPPIVPPIIVLTPTWTPGPLPLTPIPPPLSTSTTGPSPRATVTPIPIPPGPTLPPLILTATALPLPPGPTIQPPPPPGSGQSTSGCPRPYTTRPGESLTGIAQRCGVPEATILRSNPTLPPPYDRLPGGINITLP